MADRRDTTTVYGGHHRVSTKQPRRPWFIQGCSVNPQMLWYTILVNAWLWVPFYALAYNVFEILIRSWQVRV